jgi:hypothetical protein
MCKEFEQCKIGLVDVVGETLAGISDVLGSRLDPLFVHDDHFSIKILKQGLRFSVH